LFLASLALRPQVVGLGPLLPMIRADLHLSAGIAGLLTTIPVLCMGIFAPLGPGIAARLGPRAAFGLCLAIITGFGVVRSVMPDIGLIMASTFALGAGIGIAGAIPSMVVSQSLARRPALGTGAYAGGIVAGSTLAAAVAIPLAGEGDWRRSLVIISIASGAALAAWFLLVRSAGEAAARPGRVRLPWRSGTAWLLVVLFGTQSMMYYGVVAWLPNLFVEHGWSGAEAGNLVAITNGVGLVTTLGVPFIADRFGERRIQLLVSAVFATASLAAIALVPALAYVWVALLGLALGAVFPLVLTLPLDVSDDSGHVGSVAALMLLGGYILSSVGPFLLGAARDITGSFELSVWILVMVGIVFVAATMFLSPTRLKAGIRSRTPAVAATAR
jgi:CP family cyanate transporter-like MFS transporter